MTYTEEQVALAVQTFLNEQSYNGFAIQCSTKEYAETLLRGLSLLDREWKPNDNIIREDGSVNSKWNKNKENTCYRFFFDEKNILLARRQYYEKQNLEILAFEYLMDNYLKIEKVDNIEKTKTDENEVFQNTVEKSESEIEEKDIADISPTKDAVSNITEPKNQPYIICVIFNVEINEAFHINSLNNNECNHNKTYRINSSGIREYKIDKYVWVPCNDEAELLYLLNNPDAIVKA